MTRSAFIYQKMRPVQRKTVAKLLWKIWRHILRDCLACLEIFWQQRKTSKTRMQIIRRRIYTRVWRRFNWPANPARNQFTPTTVMVCSPLGLKNTTTKLSVEEKEQLTPGHNSKGDVVPNWDFDALAGCGAICSDAEDLLKFIEA